MLLIENIAVLDVGQLMTQHTGQLALIENAPDALRYRDRGMFRIASGGKSIRRLFRNHVNLGHRQTAPVSANSCTNP